MEYTVDYFIEKFTSIPDELWCTNNYTWENKHCALGHCGSTDGYISDKGRALDELCHMYLTHSASNINDGRAFNYKQPTAKARILAALHDIKIKQQ